MKVKRCLSGRRESAKPGIDPPALYGGIGYSYLERKEFCDASLLCLSIICFEIPMDLEQTSSGEFA